VVAAFIKCLAVAEVFCLIIIFRIDIVILNEPSKLCIRKYVWK